MDAIGPHDQIPFDAFAIGQVHPGAVRVLPDARHLDAQAHHTRRQATRQDVDQVGAVHVVHRRAVACGSL
ncbi:hypothetical protein D3C79_1017640 [compost metagenome]